MSKEGDRKSHNPDIKDSESVEVSFNTQPPVCDSATAEQALVELKKLQTNPSTVDDEHSD